MTKTFQEAIVKLDKIVGGGQAIGCLEDGRKIFVWGGLPGETVKVQITKQKSKLSEGVVTEVIEASPERVKPLDQDSFLSTSPWQIMSLESEQKYKKQLINEAFELSHVNLSKDFDVFSDEHDYNYRNKVEFSWWWDNDKGQLDLAFFRRGTHGKIPVEETSLASRAINQAAQKMRNLLRNKNVEAFSLKTLLVRSNQQGEVVMQLYVKREDFPKLSDNEIQTLGAAGLEVIFSNPKSPASVITKRLQTWGKKALSDKILGIEFNYATEGFFQINLPVYEQALKDMSDWVDASRPVVDLYSGVGTIGLTIGGEHLILVEINESAVIEMKRNIAALGKAETAQAVLSPSENALDYINSEATIIVDPPRAGLHDDVVKKLLETKPERIVYLSCNPVTQARDIAKLLEKYKIAYQRGYNFFPHTPHLENLVVLDLV